MMPSRDPRSNVIPCALNVLDIFEHLSDDSPIRADFQNSFLVKKIKKKLMIKSPLECYMWLSALKQLFRKNKKQFSALFLELDNK
jgi:hypothetical protein